MADNSSILEQYKKELHMQTHPYEMWIKRNERKDSIAASPGPSEDAEAIVAEYFETHPDVDICYGDEDYLDKDGNRTEPWFKPDFSYDTFMSFNYFGNAVVLRDSFARMKYLRGVTGEKLYKELTSIVTPDMKVGHIDKILYHNPHYKLSEDHKYVYPKYDAAPDTLVSIIIPSKDHPELLENCLGTLDKLIQSEHRILFEIIIVDNGSNEENKAKVTELCDKYKAKYLYEEEEFNFSRMCNKGAKEAKGDVLFFLNDDVTVHGEDSLYNIAAHALKKHVGAVGVKLYYPGGFKIQHCGITNMGVGPAHKLGGLEDDRNLIDYYHGRNKAVYNVIAVTGAALAVEKKKFDNIGGFCEELAVAYNDVDLCFSLYEEGYVSVVRNDIAYIHHESVSRGSDETGSKQARLLEEREILYARHPAFDGYDPFYSKHLVQNRLDGEYNVEYVYPHEDNSLLSDVTEISTPSDNSYGLERKALRKGPKALVFIDVIRQLDNEYIYVEGWSSLTDQDNYMYDRYLLMTDGNKCYQISVFDKYREDIARAIKIQKYPYLTGFTARIQGYTMLLSKAKFGMMFVHKETGKKTIVYSN